MYALTTNASTTIGKQENIVKAFEQLVDNQKGFFDLSPNLPGGQPDNFDELFEQLKSKLVGFNIF